jgi:hypothetical protein
MYLFRKLPSMNIFFRWFQRVQGRVAKLFVAERVARRYPVVPKSAMDRSEGEGGADCWQCQSGHLRVTKNVQKRGKWGDCALPVGAECILEISSAAGLDEGTKTMITGEAQSAIDRGLERVVLTMVQGETSLVTMYEDGVTEVQATVELVLLKNALPLYDWENENILEVKPSL